MLSHRLPFRAQLTSRRRRVSSRVSSAVEILENRALLTVSVPVYHSNPGAAATLFLDFDGHFEAEWAGLENAASPIYTTDSDFTTFSTKELGEMLSIAERVAEDFAPFNIDVTTELPADQSHGKMLRVVIGGSTNDWYSPQVGRSVGGIAQFGSFYDTSVPNVVYAFINQQDVIGAEALIARTVSHEAGHGFNLQHQSEWDASHNLVSEYSFGNGVWSPLMGDSGSTISTWHNGPSILGWDQLQDDMAIIANSTNGFGYRADDFANTRAAATALTVSSNRFSANGIIAQNNDIDFFSFTTTGGAARLRADTTGVDPNLVPVIELYNSSGTLLATSTFTADNPAPAFLNLNLAAGTYFVAVRSNGVYGHVGQYRLSGSLSGQSNAAPVVNVGADQTATATGFALLRATVTDDSLPAPPSGITTTWTQRSGPGTVTFAHATNRNTVATFSAVGTYVLRLTASDGSYSGFDELTIVVSTGTPTNNAPLVSAGSDQTISQSGAANLNGTVSDDGRPAPANLTTHWQVIAAPGSVVFGDASAVDTTATFGSAGTYYLQLFASDGQVHGFDLVRIIVEESTPNEAPFVDAGNDQTVALADGATLNATVTDDGRPAPGNVDTLWSQTSGPGTATFGDPGAVDTTVLFSAAGTYVLRLTANDGQFTPFDEVTIVVESAGPSSTIALQQGADGYTGMTDATIKGGSPTSNSGSATIVDAHGNPDKGALLRWSVPPSLAGKTVQSASITLHVTNLTNSVYELYEVLKNWSESTVTWNQAGSGSNWAQAGARQVGTDRAAAVIGTLTSANTGFVTIELNAAGIALVQKWIDSPSSNFGLIIQDYADSTGDGVSFDSSESSTVSFRPKLTIVTEEVAPPNDPPIVDAGPNHSGTVASGAIVQGFAIDDGFPAPANLQTHWSQTSGPGTATFANPSLVETTVTFSVAGTYVLRLTANDGEFSVFDEVTIVVTGVAPPTTLALQQGVSGYSGMTDATIKGGSPTSNSGSATIVDAHGNPDKGALLRWSLPASVAGKTVQSASITLHVTNLTKSVYELYEVLRSWSESSVTWNQAASGSNWGQSGARQVGTDRAATVLGTLTSPATGFVTIQLNAVGIALVQKWINTPSTNFGLIIQDYADSTGDGVSFDSSEASTTSFRPKLTLTFAAPAALAAAARPSATAFDAAYPSQRNTASAMGSPWTTTEFVIPPAQTIRERSLLPATATTTVASFAEADFDHLEIHASGTPDVKWNTATFDDCFSASNFGRLFD